MDDFGYRDDVLEKLQTPTRALGAPKWPKPQIVKSSDTAQEPAKDGAEQEQVEPTQNSDSGRAARVAQLQALKKNAERRLPVALEEPAAQAVAPPSPVVERERNIVSKKPQVRDQATQANTQTVSVDTITEEVRSEIKALADRPLSEAEILEIYTLYSAGDRDNMLKKLKGVG